MGRLEFTAAVLSAKMSAMIHRETEFKIDQEVFWSDSTFILSYMKSINQRFKTFIANCIQHILQNSKPEQWSYVPTKENPADASSRGLGINNKNKILVRFHGSEILWKEANRMARTTSQGFEKR